LSNNTKGDEFMTDITMQATADHLEAMIRDQRLLEFPAAWGDELLFPYYGGLSLPNVTHTIAQMLDAPLPDSAPLLDDVWGDASPAGQVNRVVLMLLDGLGYQHLNMLADSDDEIHALLHDLTDGRGALPLTSIAPSTTAVALPSLWTGGTPGANGLTGTVTYLNEFSMPADMLRYKPTHGNYPVDTFFEWGLSSADVVALPGIAQHLESAAVETHVVINRMLMGSGLSHILHRGTVHAHTHTGYSDALPVLRQVLQATQGQRAYVSMYHGGVDTLAHRYGAHTDFTAREAKIWLRGLRDCLNDTAAQDGQTLFLLLADHGHYDVAHWINLRTDEKAAPIREAMTIGMMADARFGHLYLRPGTVETVKAHLEAEYADCLTYLETDSAIDAGLFGDPAAFSPRTRSRLGDLILIPRLGYGLTDPSVTDYSHLISLHAGLSDREMLVPLLWRVI
jgi:hypothetical protein